MQGFRCFCFDLNAVPGRNWNEVTAKVLPIDLQFLRIHRTGEKLLLSPCSLSDASASVDSPLFQSTGFWWIGHHWQLSSPPFPACQKSSSQVLEWGDQHWLLCFQKDVVLRFESAFGGDRVGLYFGLSSYPCLSPWYSGSRRIAGDRVPYSRVLGDLGYLSKELKERLEAKGIHLWTPLRKNMEGIDEGNIPAILAIRGTIETRIFVLNAMFDIEHPIVRSLAEWQLEIEQVLLAYHLEFFIN